MERVIRTCLHLPFFTNQEDVRCKDTIPKISVKLTEACANQWILDEGAEFLPPVILYNLIKEIIFYLYCVVCIIFISTNTE
jgi:hypothetical protein